MLNGKHLSDETTIEDSGIQKDSQVKVFDVRRKKKPVTTYENYSKEKKIENYNFNNYSGR
jgi:hypothetical protein